MQGLLPLAPVAAAPSGTRNAAVSTLRAIGDSNAALVSPTPPRLLYATAAGAGHDYAGHAECAARVPAILQALQRNGLTSLPGVVEVTDFHPAPLDLILPVHSPRYLAALEQISAGADEGVGVVVEPSPTYVTQSSYSDALRAAGAVIALVDSVVAASKLAAAGPGGSTPSAFAICRPPGHHAISQSAMGFCLLNNAAAAARHAQRHHGLQRVAVFDWDVHHGNGTEAAFYNDPSVLFISTHQSGSFPYTGKPGDVGAGAGEGFTLNLPLPGGSGHVAALAAMEEVVEPALRRFAPNIILVSAGYDAHFRDPLAGMQYQSSTYHALAAKMHSLAQELCGGRLIFLLEGGYDLQALGESVANTFAGVCGAPALEFDAAAGLYEEPGDKVRAAITEARRVHGL